MPRRSFAVALLALSLAACTEAPTPAAARSDPRVALDAATAGIGAGNYHVELALQGLSMSGSIHAPSMSAEVETRETRDGVDVRTTTRFVGDRIFVRVRMSGKRWDQQTAKVAKLGKAGQEIYEMFDGRYWMPFGRTTSPVPVVEPGGPDAVGVTATLAAADLTTGDPATITGVVDTSRVAEGEHLLGRMVRAWQTDIQGERCPIVVSVGADRRVARVDLRVRGEPGKIDLTYGDEQPVQTPPAAEIREPSPDLMEIYRSGGITSI